MTFFFFFCKIHYNCEEKIYIQSSNFESFKLESSIAARHTVEFSFLITNVHESVYYYLVRWTGNVPLSKYLKEKPIKSW